MKQLIAFRPNGVTMEELDHEFVSDFKAYLERNTDLKQNTKVSYYAKLVAALKQAVMEGYLEENPAKGLKGLKPEDTKREFLTIEEIKALINTECKSELIKWKNRTK